MTTLALIDSINVWWDELDLARQIFFGIGLFATVVTLILAVLTMLGLETQDALGAEGFDGDTDGASIFSVKPLTGFFLGFGFTGGIAMNAGFGVGAATAIAFLVGAAMMAVVVVMIRAILSVRSDGTARIADTVGSVGTVYLTLPANKASGGQVIVNFKGRQETYAALNAASKAVPSGEKVKVLSVVDPQTVLVEPL